MSNNMASKTQTITSRSSRPAVGGTGRSGIEVGVQAPAERTVAKREIRVAYHLVDIRNWKSIQRMGLLSTQRLAQLSVDTDREMLRQHRPRGAYLEIGAHIRDQSPMPPKMLERALRSGVTPAEWYELLNSKVFFWLDLERLNRHRMACKSSKQVVLAIDAGRLLDAYGDIASVSPINSGNAMRAAAPRNFTTFVPYWDWVESGWDKEIVPGGSRRPRSLKPVELTIIGGIPDLGKYVIGSVYLDPEEMLTAEHIPTPGRLSEQ